MIEYMPKTKKKKTIALCAGLVFASLAIMAFTASGFFRSFIGAYAWVVQIAAIMPAIVGMVFAERFIFTEYIYQIYDESDSMSAYPKLYINCMLGEKQKPQSCCLTFDTMISIGKKEKNTVVKERCSEFFANMRPNEVYIIKYTDSDFSEISAIALECDADFAAKIKDRIDRWGCHPEEDGE